MASRRRFLAGLAGAGALGFGTGRVAAADESAFEQPDDVTLTFDADRLARYQPLLELTDEDETRFLGLYGWVAESETRETDIMVYWTEYSNQVAPWYAPGTGHWGDREPVQVEIDPDSGDIVAVRASIYHWVKGTAGPAAVARDGQNPRLRVIDPWHQYTAASPDANTTRYEVKNLADRWQSWLDNGLDESVVPGASRDPWVMRRESDWWQAGTAGLPDAQVSVLRAARTLGFGEAGSIRGDVIE